MRYTLAILCLFVFAACSQDGGGGSQDLNGVFVTPSINTAIQASKSADSEVSSKTRICRDVHEKQSGRRVSRAVTITLFEGGKASECIYSEKWKETCVEFGTIAGNVISTKTAEGKSVEFTIENTEGTAYAITKLAVEGEEKNLDQFFPNVEARVSYKVTEEELNSIIQTFKGCQIL